MRLRAVLHISSAESEIETTKLSHESPARLKFDSNSTVRLTVNRNLICSKWFEPIFIFFGFGLKILLNLSVFFFWREHFRAWQI
jgi:hypothetical protein